jgi:hypothetical protein
MELTGGDAFMRQWSVIPADIVAGKHWVTILTAMFMRRLAAPHRQHGVSLGVRPRDRRRDGAAALSDLYLLSGAVASAAQIAAMRDSTVRIWAPAVRLPGMGRSSLPTLAIGSGRCCCSASSTA